jgi:hypothetical protein
MTETITLGDVLGFVRGASISELDQLAAAVEANKSDRRRRAIGLDSRVRIVRNVSPKYLAGLYGTVVSVDNGKYRVKMDVRTPRGEFLLCKLDLLEPVE